MSRATGRPSPTPRANPDHRDLDWLADAFLVSIGPTRLSPVVGFAWGYRRFLDDRTVLIDPEPAGTDAWERIRRRIRLDFADWETDPLPS